MRWRAGLVTVAVGWLAVGCAVDAADVGVGLPECEDVPRRPTIAMILSIQAVPSAEFAPCLDELRLGWDEVEFEAESGRAEFVILDRFRPFLTVSLTPTCDPGDAERVAGQHPEVTTYTDIDVRVGPTVTVVIIPTDRRPLARADALAQVYTATELGDRVVEFVVDPDTRLDVRERLHRAFFDADFVWIIDAIDAVEDTVQVRSGPTDEVARGVSPDEALDLMEDRLEEPAYRGTWFHTFVGGCVTYEFDATGPVAETIEEDVASAIGFYDLDALRALGRRNGVHIEQAPPPGG